MDKRQLETRLAQDEHDLDQAEISGDDYRIFHARNRAEWTRSRLREIERREERARADAEWGDTATPRELAARAVRDGFSLR